MSGQLNGLAHFSKSVLILNKFTVIVQARCVLLVERWLVRLVGLPITVVGLEVILLVGGSDRTA